MTWFSRVTQKTLLLLIVFLILGAGTLSACEGNNRREQQPTSTPIIETIELTNPEYVVQRGEIVQRITFRARVVPVLEESLYFRASGYVQDVYFERGDFVSAGEVIAILEGVENIRRQVQVQNLQIEKAEIHLENAQNALDTFLITGYYPSPTNDYELSQLQNAVRLAEIGLQETNLQLEDLEESINMSEVVAPFDGVILSLSLREGREVSGFTPVVLMGDLTDLEISAELSKNQTTLLEVGLTAKIWQANRPDIVLNGKIRQLPYVSSTSGVEDDSTTRLSVDFSSPEQRFEIGDLVSVEIEIDRKEGVLTLPVEALRKFGGRTFVIAKEDGQERSVDIEVGLEGDGLVEILEFEDRENLSEGQIVIGP